MKGNKAYIYIGSAAVLIAIGIIVVLIVLNKKQTRQPISSEKASVIRLEIPKGDNIEEDVKPSEETETAKIKTESQEEGKEKKDDKTVTSKDDLTKKENQSGETKDTKAPAVIVEKQQEDKKIGNPQNQKGNTQIGTPGTKEFPEDGDDVIELPFVPYEDLKEN